MSHYKRSTAKYNNFELNVEIRYAVEHFIYTHIYMNIYTYTSPAYVYILISAENAGTVGEDH